MDDEALSRDNLESMLKAYCPEIEPSGKASSAAEAKKLIYELNPDLIFLDINMPGRDGFSLLEQFPGRDFYVIIVTGYEEHGVRAVKFHADDYLLKPVDTDELETAVSKIMRLYAAKTKPAHKALKDSSAEKIIVTHLKGFTVLELSEIVRIEGEGNYSKIFLSDGRHILSSRPLGDFEAVLNNKFIRVHKSHIINLDYLKEYENIDGGYAVMKDRSKIMISRRKLQDFLKKVDVSTIKLK